MKICSKCHKEVDEYVRGRRCRECYNEYLNDYMKKKYVVTIAWIREYKVSKGCIDCGYNKHHAGLEFDHVEPRNGDTNRTIARLAARGVEVVKREIEKCEVVCGTCHGIRTWERKQNLGPLV